MESFWPIHFSSMTCSDTTQSTKIYKAESFQGTNLRGKGERLWGPMYSFLHISRLQMSNFCRNPWQASLQPGWMPWALHPIMPRSSRRACSTPTTELDRRRLPPVSWKSWEEPMPRSQNTGLPLWVVILSLPWAKSLEPWLQSGKSLPCSLREANFDHSGLIDVTDYRDPGKNKLIIIFKMVSRRLQVIELNSF